MAILQFFGPYSAQGRRRGLVYQGNPNPIVIPGNKLPTPSTLRSMAVPVQPWTNPQVSAQMSLAMAASYWRGMTAAQQELWVPEPYLAKTNYGWFQYINGNRPMWGLPILDVPYVPSTAAYQSGCRIYTDPSTGRALLYCGMFPALPLGNTYSFAVSWAWNVALASPRPYIGSGIAWTPPWTPQYNFIGRFDGIPEDTPVTFDITDIVTGLLGTVPENEVLINPPGQYVGGNGYVRYWPLENGNLICIPGFTYPTLPPFDGQSWVVPV